jgi:hypothetical protein
MNERWHRRNGARDKLLMVFQRREDGVDDSSSGQRGLDDGEEEVIGSRENVCAEGRFGRKSVPVPSSWQIACPVFVTRPSAPI